MAGALRTWASCWLATSAIAPAALAEAAARECAAQDCEFEDNSLLSIRRVGTQPPFDSSQPPHRVLQQNPTMHIVSPSKYTPADTGDDIEVFWLKAVLGAVSGIASKTFGKGTLLYKLTTELVGLYHVGIGFRNKRTGLETVAQHLALNFGLDIIVPKVDSSTWTWNRTAVLQFEEGQFNTGYWSGYDQSPVATIKGSDYNRLVTEVIGVMAENQRPYVLFTPSLLNHEVSIQPHLPGVPAAPGLPPGSETCMDAAALILRGLQEIAGSQVFDMSNLVTRNDQYLWMKPGTKAVKLDISGGLGTPDYDFALNFFIAMQTALDDPSFSGKKLEDLFLIADSDVVFADVNDDYWRLTPNFLDFLFYTKSTVPPVFVTPVAM